MTATANFRQMAQHIGLAICTLIMRTAFWVSGILWYIIRDCKRSVPSGDRCNRGYPFHHPVLWLHPLVIHPLTLTDMAKRNSKTAAQQCRYYEVDNIFVYMVETYINGNFETFRRLYHELNKDARRDFMDFLLSEVEPTYWREILKQII